MVKNSFPKMASKDDSPTSFHGQPWSVWADRLGRDSPLSDSDEQSKVNKSKEGDAMKLPKQDMTYYGLCPVRDEFYLVTCNYCRRVCTPQGLKSHIESKHAQEWTTSCNQQVTDSVDSCVSNAGTANVNSAGISAMPGPPTSRPKAAKKAQAAGQATAALPTSLAFLLATPAAPSSNSSNNHRSRATGGNKRTAGKTALPAPLSSALTGTAYDKIPSPQQPPPPASSQGSLAPIQFSPLQPTLTAPSPVSPLTCGGTSVLTPSPAITMTVAVDSSGNQTVQIHLPELGNGVTLADSPTDVTPVLHRAIGPTVNTTTTNTKKRKNSSKADGTGRKLLPLKERELDLEKHCGVWIVDDNRACTRSLTCKAHSLTLRRNVQGRSRTFDDLLAEHRATKELVTKQLKEGTTGATHTAPSLPQGAATKTAAATPPTGAQGPSKLGRPPISRAPPAKKLLTSLLQQQQQQSTGAAELSITVDLPPVTTETLSNLQVPVSSGLLQKAAFPSHLQTVSSQSHEPVSLTFTPHHPKPLAVCSFGLRRRQVVVTTDRKWDFLRTTLRSALMRPTAATTKAATVHRSGPQSLLRPSIVASHQNHHNNLNSPLQLRESNSIELPNGLQLSIGVQPDGHNLGHHRVRLKKTLLNGLTKGGHGSSVHQLDQHHSSDDMEGFDGLVGEDGVLTFLNQTEGTASLSLMADLSAGNITFSELNNHHHPAGTGGGIGATPTRLLPSATVSSTSTGIPFQLLQSDPDFL